MDKVIMEWHISDYDGRKTGDPVLINGIESYRCKRLSSWIRVGKYLVKYEWLLWFLESHLEKYGRYYSCDSDKQGGFQIVANEINSLLNGRDLLNVAKEAETYINTFPNRYRWFYAQFKDLPKKQVDSLSDEYLTDYFM